MSSGKVSRKARQVFVALAESAGKVKQKELAFDFGVTAGRLMLRKGELALTLATFGYAARLVAVGRMLRLQSPSDQRRRSVAVHRDQTPYGLCHDMGLFFSFDSSTVGFLHVLSLVAQSSVNQRGLAGVPDVKSF